MLALALGSASAASAQTSPAAAAPAVYTYVEQMPQPPGGMDGLMQYIRQNLNYPEEAAQSGVQGKVFVNFIIDTQGNIQSPTVTKGIGAGCDEEALRVISSMPAWTPGKQNGRTVNVSYTVPIFFKITAPAETPVEPAAATVTFKQAAYPGGPEALRAYLNAVPYPAGFSPPSQPVRVFVQFTVDATGKATEVQAVRPLPKEEEKRLRQQPVLAALPKELLAAAEQRIAAMPGWKPASKDGQPVVRNFTVPVTFGNSAGSGPYLYAEQMPAFPEPEGEMATFARNVRYPSTALRAQTQGKVLIYYEVSEQGQVENAEVLRSVSREVDQEALRVLTMMYPKYRPAQHNGQPVRVFYVVPISFAIR